MRHPTLVRGALLGLLGLLIALSASEVGAQSEKIVATHYFYWYRWPDQHFNEPGAPGIEGHARHFLDPESVSYLSVEWHEAQFRAMGWAGIDIALPVYWGAPGVYERPGVSFSRAGLPPMVEAAKRLGKEGVRLGLFYDTSTLRNGVRGVAPASEGADLTTAAGTELFCRTVVEYFECIPKELWGRVEGGPLVVLYTSAFSSRWDARLGDRLRAAFAKRFPGERPFLVADHSWGKIGQDRTTAWGAALNGPQLFPGVAQIGAGYDDSPVPGRRTPKREREEGTFFRHSWRAAVAHDPALVLIETWNEMHEGTEICETREEGLRYVEINAAWVLRLKRGLAPGPEIPLHWTAPRPRRDDSFGTDAGKLRAVIVAPKRIEGLRVIPWEDGPIARSETAIATPGTGDATRYLYFQVADAFRFDIDPVGEDFILEIEGSLPESIVCQYDGHDQAAALAGAYTTARRLGGEDGPTRFLLDRARFANRQNGGADFRLAYRRGAVELSSVALMPRE